MKIVILITMKNQNDGGRDILIKIVLLLYISDL